MSLDNLTRKLSIGGKLGVALLSAALMQDVPLAQAQEAAKKSPGLSMTYSQDFQNGVKVVYERKADKAWVYVRQRDNYYDMNKDWTIEVPKDVYNVLPSDVTERFKRLIGGEKFSIVAKAPPVAAPIPAPVAAPKLNAEIATVSPTPQIDALEEIAIDYPEARKYIPAVKKCEADYGSDPVIIMGIMQKESSIGIKIVSPVGALGIMQFMPTTAEEHGLNSPYPILNYGRRDYARDSRIIDIYSSEGRKATLAQRLKAKQRMQNYSRTVKNLVKQAKSQGTDIAKEFTVFNPEANIDAGCRYLAKLTEQYGLEDALTAWNAGPNGLIRKRRWGGVKAFREGVLDFHDTYHYPHEQPLPAKQLPLSSN